MKTKIKNLLEQINDSIEELYTLLDNKELQCYGLPDDYTNDQWRLCGDESISWGDYDAEYDAFTYSAEARNIFRGEDFTICRLNHGCGDGWNISIFDNEKEIKWKDK